VLSSKSTNELSRWCPKQKETTSANTPKNTTKVKHLKGDLAMCGSYFFYNEMDTQSKPTDSSIVKDDRGISNINE
jgi:transglutaminase/protease-like cytokinesis protein 3